MPCLMLLALLLTGTAFAAEPKTIKDHVLDTVIVTADKQEKDVREIPGSVSVITGVQIEDYGIKDTGEIYARTPNMHLVKTGPKAAFASFASMRGVSSFMSGNPSVGFYVDDVYYPGFEINFLDLERIEILRGPQGTLYGRNTEAGVINIVTRKAENEWKTKPGITLSSFNTMGASLTTGGALVQDTLYLRGTFNYLSSDGYFTNTVDDSDDVNKNEDVDGRASVRWTPNKIWDVSLTTEIQDYNSNFAEFAPLDGIKDNPHEVSVDYEGVAEKQAQAASLRASAEMGKMKFLSISAYRNEDYRLNNDVDFTAFDIMRLNLGKKIDLASQEFRLYSTDKETPFKWLTGAYFFSESDAQDIETEFRAMGSSFFQNGDTDTFGAALFGQASYTLWDKLELTAGLRYDREKKEFDYEWKGGLPIGVPDETGSNDKVFQAWLPKFAVAYHVTDDLNTYLSIARGFKSGGFNIKAAAGDSYDSEYTWSYELGLKSDWLEKQLQFNMAAFYIDWEDMQVELPEYPDFTVVNAGSATSMGLEAELKARPAKGLEILSSIGFTYATYDEFERSGNDLEGNRVPNVPGFSAQLGGTYRFENGLLLNANYQRTGSMYYDAENTRKQQAYQTVNAKLGYEIENCEIYLFAKNLFNSVYPTRAFTIGGNWVGRAGDPRTIGINAAIRF